MTSERTMQCANDTLAINSQFDLVNILELKSHRNPLPNNNDASSIEAKKPLSKLMLTFFLREIPQKFISVMVI